MSLQSIIFSSRTVLSDLSTLLGSSEGATLADGNSTCADQSTGADHQAGSSPSLQDIPRIWSLLFEKTDPTPTLPLGPLRLVPGKLIYFKASHFELIRSGDSTDSPRVGEGACYIVEKRRLSALHGGSVIAVKTPKLRRLASSDLVASLVLRELQILTHPPLQANDNIASIVGYYSSQVIDDSSLGLSLVTELASHGTLGDYLRRPLIEGRRPHALTTKLGLLHDVASGLEALHACGIVQGDVKTENVLVFDAKHDKYGQVTAKLSDFGHAITFHKDKLDEKKLYLGTLVLNAPEARHRDAVAARDLWRCDVFSYGLVIWETIIDGARYFSAVDDPALQNGVTDWLDSLPQDEMLRLATTSLNQIYGSLERPLLDTIERILKVSLRDDSSNRKEVKDITRILRQQTFLAAIARARSADKAIPAQPFASDGGASRDLVRQDGLDMVPMPVRESIVQQLERTSLSHDASASIRRSAHLDLAFASFSNFRGKADPSRGMKHLRDAAAMGSSVALAIYCRLQGVFNTEMSLVDTEFSPSLSDLRTRLLALPGGSPLSTWLRAIEAYHQRQALQTRLRVTLSDQMLMDGVFLDAIEMHSHPEGLDVEVLTATVVSSVDTQANPCFESPLLVGIACRLGNLDLVKQILALHSSQHLPKKSRYLVGNCLVQACRGGHIHVVEYLLKHVAEPYFLWPESDRGIHWLFMFPSEEQQRALDLMTNTSHMWHISLFHRVPEPGVHVGLATLTGSPIEFATAVGATSTVELLVTRITELQQKGFLSQVTEVQFRQAIMRHVASSVKTLLPLEIRRRRGRNVESALARLRLSQGKTEFRPFGIFDVGRSVSSLSLALLHGSAKAMSRATEHTIDMILTSKIAHINDVDDTDMAQTPLIDAVRWAPCAFDTEILASFISRGAHLGDMPAPVILSRLIAPRPTGTKCPVMRRLVEAGLLKIDDSLILQAVETADVEIVSALLDYQLVPSLDQPLKVRGDAIGITPLQAAVLIPGGAGLVRFLIDKGADIDEAGDGLSPLELSLIKPSDADVIDLLVNKGADLKASGYPTVIHLAATLDVFVNGSHVLSHLLRHERVRARLAESQVAQQGDIIFSPVHVACLVANVEAVAALFEVGVELPHDDGTMDVLAQSILLAKRPHLNKLFPIPEDDQDAVFQWKVRSERLILYLLDRLESNHGQTPLHVACQVGNLRRVQDLIEEDFGALFATDSHGRLPIDFLEDPIPLEEQRSDREDISEHTVSNAQQLLNYVEMTVDRKLFSAAEEFMSQNMDQENLNHLKSRLSLGQTPAMDVSYGDSTGAARPSTDLRIISEPEPEPLGYGESFNALAEKSAESGREGRASSLQEGADACFLDGNMDPEEVLPIVRDLFGRRIQQLGELHEETLEVNETLLELVGILNRQDEAADMVAQLLRRRREIHQQDDARIFESWRDSVIVMLNEGKDEESEKELCKAMSAAKSSLGASHLSYLLFLPTQATFECLRGNYSECLLTNKRLLETLKASEYQNQRGMSLRLEVLVHLCYHGLGEGDMDTVRKHMTAALECLNHTEPRRFLAKFDVMRSLATAIEEADVVLSETLWKELVSICVSRCEPQGYCIVESRRHLARILMSRDMFQDAYDQYHQLTQAILICKGQDDEATLLASTDEARVLHKLNLNPAALNLLRPAIRGLEKRKSGRDEDIQTLEAKVLLAQILLALDDLDEWEVVAREVAGEYAQRHPTSDVAVDSKRTLAVTLSRMGRSSEASNIAEECLKITTEVHQENHPRTMAIVAEAHLYLVRCEQWAPSVHMSERGLAIAKALHGESSHEVAGWLHLLGTSMGLADMEGGLELLLQSIDMTVQLAGGAHSRSSLTSMWSAGVRLREGSPQKALKMFCEVLESCDSLDDEPRSLKIRVRTDIGRCYTDLEQYTEALPHLEQSLRESRQLWGDSARETVSVIDSLINVLLPMRRAKEALPLAHEVLDFFESTAARSEDELIDAKSRLADVYYSLDKCLAAERLWEQALEDLAELGDEADQDKVASYRHSRARALVEIFDFEEATNLSSLAFDYYQRTKGPEAEETLSVSITRAYINGLLGKKAASETALLDVIKLSKRTQDLDYLVGHAEAKLGGLWIEMGKHQEAEKVLLRAVQRIEKDLTARHLLYRTYKEQMKYEAAEEQAAMLLSMVSEDVDEEAIDAELRLFELYAAMDDFDKAQAWADSLFDRLTHLTDYQGNPFDVASALQHLIKFFERTKDEQKLFEARVVLEHVRENLPLRLKSNLLWRSLKSQEGKSHRE